MHHRNFFQLFLKLSVFLSALLEASAWMRMALLNRKSDRRYVQFQRVPKARNPEIIFIVTDRILQPCFTIFILKNCSHLIQDLRIYFIIIGKNNFEIYD